MRIVVSNPDNIGDFVIRQPMLAALHEAGHELLVATRDAVAPVAAIVCPYARVLVCPGNPYSPGYHLDTSQGREFVQRLQAFQPDLLVIAPYQHTEQEEQLAAALPEAGCVGFHGPLYQSRPHVTQSSTIPFATQATVSPDMAEVRKNELLCAAILGPGIQLDRPRIAPDPASLAAAGKRIRKLGLEPGKFWAVAAGDSPARRIRNWGHGEWSELCRRIAEQEQTPLFFVGTPDEHESTEAIRLGMGPAAKRTLTMTNEAMDIGTLIGMLSLSAGYIGRDTGTMHLAAALGKPVLAVFGGGDWPRFVPAAGVGRVFTVHVPCTGCRWICYLSTSHCVKDVPVDEVLPAAIQMIRGEMDDFQVVVIQPDAMQQAAIVRDAWEKARANHLAIERERAEFLQWHSDRVRDIEGLNHQVESLRQERDGLLAHVPPPVDGGEHFRQRALRKLVEGRTLRRSLRQECDALRLERDQLSKELAASPDSLALLAEQEALMARIGDQSVVIGVLQAQVDTADTEHLGRIRDLERLLGRKTEELHSAAAVIPDLRGELTLQSAEADRQAALAEAAGLRSKALANRLAGVETELLQAVSAHGALADRLFDAERDQRAKQALILDLSQRMEEVEADRLARLHLIETLSGKLEEVEADRAERLRIIETLHARVIAIEAEAEERLRLVESLSEQVARLGAERDAANQTTEFARGQVAMIEEEASKRLRLLEAASADLERIETDRAARLRLIGQLTEDISALTQRLAIIEADRKDRGTQIAILHEEIEKLRSGLDSIHNQFTYRMLKTLRLT